MLDNLISIETLLNSFDIAEQILDKHGSVVIIANNEPMYILTRFSGNADRLIVGPENRGPVDNEQLTRLLNGIGQRVFVTYFSNFMNNEDPTVFLAKEGFNLNSIRSRASKARSIIRNGWIEEALTLIIHSVRTDYEIRKQAKCILASLHEDGQI